MSKLLQRAILLAIALAWPCAAFAQNQTCPTPATGDNSNKCSSTAFVKNVVSSALPLPQGFMYVGNASNFAAGVLPSGDCSVSVAGIIICTKTNGVAFGPFATQSAPCTIAQGCTAQTTAVAARQASGLNILGDAGTAHGDVTTTLGNTERMAYTSAALTAPRSWTLPAANVTGAPYAVIIQDMAGGVTATNTLTAVRAGSDSVNGGTGAVISTAYGGLSCYSNGVSRWDCTQLSATALSGPASSVVGNIAFFNNTSGTLLGAAPAFQSGNPGNAALYSVLANPANGYTTLYNGLQFSQGAAIPASRQFGANVAGVQQALSVTLNLASGDTATQGNGVAGYAESNSTNQSPVGAFGQASFGLNGGNGFGGNFIASNCITVIAGACFNIGFETGVEFNPGFWTTPTGNPTIAAGAYGVWIQGNGNVTGPFGSAAIGIGTASAPTLTNAQWNNAIWSRDGSAVVALRAGAVSTVNGSESQSLVFNSINGSGVSKTASTFSDANGALYCSPSAAQNCIVTNGATLQILSMSVAGVITNDASGLLTSISSLTAGLGGTGQTSYAVGDTLYASGAAALSKLAGNITTSKLYYSQTGTGSASQAPAWSAISGSDITGAALTKTDDTNVTLTLGGTPATSLLRAASLTLGWTGTLAAARLNSNVVQAISNDTNVTGSISAQTLTLAWSGTLANSRLAPMATNTVKVNVTSGSASPTDLAVASCSSASSALIWTTNTGFGCNTSITAAAAPVSGLTGAGTGVLAALAVNVGSAGALVTFNGALGSPLSVGTMPAFTLGGTISGGGNNINNVNVGISSPGTGAFTTLGATGVATFNNSGGAGPTPLTGDVLRLLQADGVTNRFTMEVANASNAFGGRATGGTMASPAATIAGTSLIQLSGYGYTNALQTGSNGVITIAADSLWSATNAATRIGFFTTPTGSVVRAEVARVQPSGGVSIGATAISTDPGAGALSIDGTLTAAAYKAGATAGVSCSGAPTGSFVSVNGIVTHC